MQLHKLRCRECGDCPCRVVRSTQPTSMHPCNQIASSFHRTNICTSAHPIFSSSSIFPLPATTNRSTVTSAPHKIGSLPHVPHVTEQPQVCVCALIVACSTNLLACDPSTRPCHPSPVARRSCRFPSRSRLAPSHLPIVPTPLPASPTSPPQLLADRVPSHPAVDARQSLKCDTPALFTSSPLFVTALFDPPDLKSFV